jgi:hypothetical protein
LALFQELDEELGKTKTHGDVFIVGGAAMAVAYSARPATRDVDAIWQPSSEIRDAAARVAARHDDIPPDWLNDGVKSYLPGEDKQPRTVYDGEFLSVSAPSPEYLLATKLLASPVSRDEADILKLYEILGLKTVKEGLDLVQAFYPGRPTEAKAQFFLEELLDGRSRNTE